MRSWKKNGVEVRLLGGRAGLSTGLLFRVGEQALLVDCGDGMARELDRLGLPAGQLSAVLLTHDHWDHAAGLPGLLWWLRSSYRSEPLPLVRPPQAHLTDGIVRLFRRVFDGRTRFTIQLRQLTEGKQLSCPPFAVEAFPVRHRRSSSDPLGMLMEAVGLVVKVHDMKLVVSGDTGPCPRLEEELAGADLALIEATYPVSMKNPPPDTHLRKDQAEELGKKARACLLYHQGQ